MNFCPSAKRPEYNAGDTGGMGGSLGGGTFEAYGVFPDNDPRYGYANLAGSYGINDWVGDPAHARVPSNIHGEPAWYWRLLT